MSDLQEETALKFYRIYGFIEPDFSKFKEMIFSNAQKSNSPNYHNKIVKDNIDKYLCQVIKEDGIVEIISKAYNHIGSCNKTFLVFNNLIIKNKLQISGKDVFELANDPDYNAYFKELIYKYNYKIEKREHPFELNSLLYRIVDSLNEDITFAHSNDALRDYLIYINSFRILTKKELNDLFVKYHEGGPESEEAKDKIVNHNLKLVVSIANRYYKPNLKMEFLDLVQEGNFGLIKAVEVYDPEKGNAFSTCAYWWIMQKITRSIIEKGYTIRVAYNKYLMIKKFERFKDTFYNQNFRYPTDQEIKEGLGLSKNKISELTREIMLMNIVSLDQPVDSHNGKNDAADAPLGFFISDDDENPEEEGMRSLLQSQQEEIMDKVLTVREKEIIRYRFGLDDNVERSLEQVGKIFHVTRERIRQIEKKALEKLRKYDKLNKVLHVNEENDFNSKFKKDNVKIKIEYIDSSKYKVIDHLGDYSSVFVECLRCGYKSWLSSEELTKDELCSKCRFTKMSKSIKKIEKKEEINMKEKRKINEILGINRAVYIFFLETLKKEDQELLNKAEVESLTPYEHSIKHMLIKRLEKYISYFNIEDNNKIQKKQPHIILDVSEDEVKETFQQIYPISELKNIYNDSIICDPQEVLSYSSIISNLRRRISIKKGLNDTNRKKSSRSRTINEIIGSNVSNNLLDALINRLSDSEKELIEKRKTHALNTDETKQFSSIVKRLKNRLNAVQKDMTYSPDIDLVKIIQESGYNYLDFFNSLTKESHRLVSKHLKGELNVDEKIRFMELVECTKISMGIYDGLSKVKDKKNLNELLYATPEEVSKALEQLNDEEKELIKNRNERPLDKKESIEFNRIRGRLRTLILQSRRKAGELSVEDSLDNNEDKSVSSKLVNNNDTCKKSKNENFEIDYGEQEVGKGCKIVFYNCVRDNLAKIIKDIEIIHTVSTRDLNITCQRLGIGEGMAPHKAEQVAAYYGITPEEVNEITIKTFDILDRRLDDVINTHINEQYTRSLKKEIYKQG